MFEVNVRTDAVDLYLHDFMHRAAARRLADYDVQVYRCSRYVWKTLWPIHKMVWCVYINLKCATVPHIEQKETTHHFTSRQQQGRGISTLYIRRLSGIPRADLHNTPCVVFPCSSHSSSYLSKIWTRLVVKDTLSVFNMGIIFILHTCNITETQMAPQKVFKETIHVHNQASYSKYRSVSV